MPGTPAPTTAQATSLANHWNHLGLYDENGNQWTAASAISDWMNYTENMRRKHEIMIAIAIAAGW